MKKIYCLLLKGVFVFSFFLNTVATLMPFEAKSTYLSHKLFFPHFTLVLLWILMLLVDITVIDMYWILFEIKKLVKACIVSANIWTTPMLFEQCMWDRPAMKRHLSSWCLEGLDTSYMMGWHMA
jgi:hypothetical protein